MIKVLIGLLLPLMYIFVVKSQYTIIQSQHYELNKYFKYELRKKIVIQSLQIILFSLTFFTNNYLYYTSIITSAILNIFLINKQSLKYTPRIKRFLIIYCLLVSLLYIGLPFSYLKSFLLINCSILPLLITAHYISILLENIIMFFYIKNAQKIVKDKKIIGITGSYGKTSSKNILYDMLESLCNVSKTPKSYNTKVGIVKSIRENVNKFDDVFICEYGVDRKRGMDKLLKIVKPNISLITEVGPQHLLTFKNITNIKKEKIKLAKILKSDEVAVINNDNRHLSSEIKKIKCKVITYGIESNSEIRAKNIKVDKNGSSFDLYINDKKIKRLHINLLGKHNILNTLGAIGVLKALNMNLNKVDELVKNVKPVKHRLELKEINGIKAIDDSFNSNQVGFKNAIDVLSLMKEKRIVITPGIIEQGPNSYKINYELGKYMYGKVDLVILVEKNSFIIKEGLINSGFNPKKIIEKKDFLEAWNYVKENIKEENKIILIENDLPSIYLR